MIQMWEKNREKLDKDKSEKLEKARETAAKLKEIVIEISSLAGKDGKLFGSITSGDIAKYLIGKGFSVDRKWVELRESIRATGEYQGAVRLHPSVRAVFKIQVSAQS